MSNLSALAALSTSMLSAISYNTPIQCGPLTPDVQNEDFAPSHTKSEFLIGESTIEMTWRHSPMLFDQLGNSAHHPISVDLDPSVMDQTSDDAFDQRSPSPSAAIYSGRVSPEAHESLGGMAPPKAISQETGEHSGNICLEAGPLAPSKIMASNGYMSNPWNTLPHSFTNQSSVHNDAVVTQNEPLQTRRQDISEKDLWQTLDKLQGRYGPRHPASMDALSRLVTVLQDGGRYVTATLLLSAESRAKDEETRLKAQGLHHMQNMSPDLQLQDMLRTDILLSYTLNKQKKYDEAERVEKDILGRFEQVLGPDHEETYLSVFRLGSIYSSQGRLNESFSMFERARGGLISRLGAEHPKTKACSDSYFSTILDIERRDRVFQGSN